MHARLEQRADQRLALLPEMLRSVEILQLAADDLGAFLDREIEGNETLLARRPARGDAGGEGGVALARAVAPPTDLRAWLELQLAWRTCPAPLVERVLALADLLDERGLLPHDDEALIAAAGAEHWHEALAVLQTLEPRGLGARTAVESMLLQLDGADPDREDIALLLTEHLDALARNRTPEVARALDLSVDELERLIDRVRALTPRPAAAFVAQECAPLRVELEARFEDGMVVVRALGDSLPELRLDPRYVRLARRGEPGLRRYLRPKLAAARGLIRAVGLRQRTLLRVAGAVLQRQTEFLKHGMRAMRALRMAEVADELGCHTSTISRAIAGKWVATEHGALPLRAFFDGARLAPEAQATLGLRGVRERVREIIAGEDPRRPLSDDQVAALLSSEGVEIARRTVAKYRTELGIGSQWRRRSP